MLPFLLDWVAQYYERDDAMSYAAHRRIFDAFAGSKRETGDRPGDGPRFSGN